MVRSQGIWAVLVALAAGNTMSASVTATAQPVFRHIYSLHHNGRVAIQTFTAM